MQCGSNHAAHRSRRASRPLSWRAITYLLVAAIFLRPAIGLSQPPQGQDQTKLEQKLVVTAEIDEGPLSDGLVWLEFYGKVKVIGDAQAPVPGMVIRAYNLTDAIQQFSEQTGFLVVRRGERSFTVYSDNAEEELQRMGRDEISYLYRFQRLRANDAITMIEGTRIDGQTTPLPRSIPFPGSFGEKVGVPSSQFGGAGGAYGVNTGMNVMDQQSSMGLQTPPYGNTARSGTNNPSQPPGNQSQPAIPNSQGDPSSGAPVMTPEDTPPTEQSTGIGSSISRKTISSAGRRSSLQGAGKLSPKKSRSSVRQAAYQEPEPENPDVPATVTEDMATKVSPPSPPQRTFGRGLDRPLGNVNYQLIEQLNGLLIIGPLAEVRKAIEFIKIIDQPIPVVLVELMIIQYNHGDNFDWKFDVVNGRLAQGNLYPNYVPFGSATAGGPTESLYNFGPRPGAFDLSGLVSSAGSGSLAYTGVGSLASGFAANVKLLVSKNQARVVTNPHVAVTNGTTGYIVLNEIFNFPTSVSTNLGAVTNNGLPASLQSKTILHVTPTVVSSNTIHMAVNSELTVFADQADITGVTTIPDPKNPATLPAQRQNLLGTSITLEENQTIIIGGLVKEEATEVRNGVPILQEFPLVGPFFRSRSTKRNFIETVIYITPHLTEKDGYQGFEDAYVKQAQCQIENLNDRDQMVKAHFLADKDRTAMNRQIERQVDHVRYTDRLKRGLARPFQWLKRKPPDCPPEGPPAAEYSPKNQRQEPVPAVPQTPPDPMPDQESTRVSMRDGKWISASGGPALVPKSRPRQKPGSAPSGR